MTTSIKETPAQTAKKVRKAVKAAFPGQKFSVTTDNYSMGSSIDVSWIDGPMQDEVSDVARKFSSTSFDGMDDSSNHHGYEFEGQRYQGADYIFATRHLSTEYEAKLDETLKSYFSEESFNGLDAAQKHSWRLKLEKEGKI